MLYFRVLIGTICYTATIPFIAIITKNSSAVVMLAGVDRVPPHLRHLICCPCMLFNQLWQLKHETDSSGETNSRLGLIIVRIYSHPDKMYILGLG